MSSVLSSLEQEIEHVFVMLSQRVGKSYFADLRMTFRQKNVLQDWFRNKLGVGLG
jgi:hypothetical protein